MAIDTQRVSLDISKQPTLQVVRLGQGDENGTELVATVYDEGQAYDLTGKSVRLRIQLPGGYAEYHVDGTVSGNEATFAIDEAYAASVAGITDNAYVEVLQGDTVVCSTSRFRVVILPSAYEGTDPAHIWDNGVNEFLQSANAQVRELTQDATEAINAAANAESSAAAELDAALDALGDISEIAVPLMSTTTRGGAKLGSGLAVTEGKLRTQLVQGGQGIANTPIQADGDLLHGATVDGMSVQDGTPTPSAPVPVQVVETANLIDWSDLPTRTTNGVTWSYNGDGWVKAEGTASSTSYAQAAPTQQTLQNGYIAYCTPGTYTANGDCDFNVFAMDGDGTGEPLRTYLKEPYTFTLTEAKYIQLGLRVSSGTVTNTVYHVQLIRGTTPQPYVPYGSLGLCVKGKNLIPHPYADGEFKGTNGIAFTMRADGSVAMKGTATANAFYNFIAPAQQVPAVPNTDYSLTLDSDVPSGVVVVIGRQKNGTNYENSSLSSGSHLTKRYSDDGYIRMYVQVNSGATVNAVIRPMLAFGSAAIPYTPYVDSTTPIPLQSNVLASLPDGTRDEVTVDELGRVKLVKRVGIITFDGSEDESWSGYNYTHGHGYYTGMPNPSVSANANIAISTGFTCVQSNGYAYDGNFYVSVSGGNWALNFVCESPADVAAWRTYLAANPLTVYYKLATPTTIDLGTIDLPKLADGATIEALANLDTGIAADWWAVGAGAVGDGLLALRDLLGAGE